MRKVVLVVALLCVFSCLFAEESVAVDLSGMDEQEKFAFMFYYGYEAIMQKSCKGAFLALDQDMNFIGGWQTDQTPDDFCTNIPGGTVATMQVLPIGLAKAMFYLLEDGETVARLEGMEKGIGIYAVCLFLPYEGMELEAPAYNYGKRLLEDEAIRHGLNPEDFFAFMQAQGVSEESLVYTMYNDIATASEIVLDAMGMMQEEKRSFIKSISDKLALACVLCFGVIVLVLLVLILHGKIVEKKLKKAEEKAKIDKHNEEVES